MMKKVFVLLFAAAFLVTNAAATLPNESISKSKTRGDETRYYDSQNHYQGRAVTRDGVTRYYDKQNHYQGKSVEKDGQRFYYDKTGHIRK